MIQLRLLVEYTTMLEMFTYTLHTISGPIQHTYDDFITLALSAFTANLKKAVLGNGKMFAVRADGCLGFSGGNLNGSCKFYASATIPPDFHME